MTMDLCLSNQEKWGLDLSPGIYHVTLGNKLILLRLDLFLSQNIHVIN
jgi:hypothetical protein